MVKPTSGLQNTSRCLLGQNKHLSSSKDPAKDTAGGGGAGEAKSGLSPSRYLQSRSTEKQSHQFPKNILSHLKTAEIKKTAF